MSTPQASRAVRRGLRLSDQQALTLRDAEVVVEEGGVKARQEVAKITQQLLEVTKTPGFFLVGSLTRYKHSYQKETQPRSSMQLKMIKVQGNGLLLYTNIFFSLSLSLCCCFVFVPIRKYVNE